MFLFQMNLNMNINEMIAFIFVCVFCLSQSAISSNDSLQCENDMTRCMLSSGKYGCCPLPSGTAECCADGLHCCPNGNKCDNKDGSCHPIRAEMRINLMMELKSSSNGLCPDKNHTCPQFETCCREKSGSYGCCPYNLAVCCKDLLHCCPHSTKCDLKHKQCVHSSNDINSKRGFSFGKEMRLIGFEAQNITDIVCPGGRYECPDGNTCCSISDTLWGCCPLENAVCCDDKIHCCPNGYKCWDTGCQSL